MSHASNALMKNPQVVGPHLSDRRLLPLIYGRPYAQNNTAYDGIEVITRSHPDAFPSALRQKRKTQTKLHEEGDKGTLVGPTVPLQQRTPSIASIIRI